MSHFSPSYPSIHPKMHDPSTLLQSLFGPPHCLLQFSEQFAPNLCLLHAEWVEWDEETAASVIAT